MRLTMIVSGGGKPIATRITSKPGRQRTDNHVSEHDTPPTHKPAVLLSFPLDDALLKGTAAPEGRNQRRLENKLHSLDVFVQAVVLLLERPPALLRASPSSAPFFFL